ncbi:MAG: hypothetical protein R2857_13690 [Vampirovibrionales bacterium]
MDVTIEDGADMDDLLAAMQPDDTAFDDRTACEPELDLSEYLDEINDEVTDETSQDEPELFAVIDDDASTDMPGTGHDDDLLPGLASIDLDMDDLFDDLLAPADAEPDAEAMLSDEPSDDAVVSLEDLVAEAVESATGYDSHDSYLGHGDDSGHGEVLAEDGSAYIMAFADADHHGEPVELVSADPGAIGDLMKDVDETLMSDSPSIRQDDETDALLAGLDLDDLVVDVDSIDTSLGQLGQTFDSVPVAPDMAGGEAQAEVGLSLEPEEAAWHEAMAFDLDDLTFSTQPALPEGDHTHTLEEAVPVMDVVIEDDEVLSFDLPSAEDFTTLTSDSPLDSEPRPEPEQVARLQDTDVAEPELAQDDWTGQAALTGYLEELETLLGDSAQPGLPAVAQPPAYPPAAVAQSPIQLEGLFLDNSSAIQPMSPPVSASSTAPSPMSAPAAAQQPAHYYPPASSSYTSSYVSSDASSQAFRFNTALLDDMLEEGAVTPPSEVHAHAPVVVSQPSSAVLPANAPHPSSTSMPQATAAVEPALIEARQIADMMGTTLPEADAAGEVADEIAQLMGAPNLVQPDAHQQTAEHLMTMMVDSTRQADQSIDPALEAALDEEFSHQDGGQQQAALSRGAVSERSEPVETAGMAESLRRPAERNIFNAADDRDYEEVERFSDWDDPSHDGPLFHHEAAEPAVVDGGTHALAALTDEVALDETAFGTLDEALGGALGGTLDDDDMDFDGFDFDDPLPEHAAVKPVRQAAEPEPMVVPAVDMGMMAIDRNYSPGQRVQHKRYGLGTVKRVITMDDDQIILNVVFERVGKRLLDPNLTHLEKVS